jgi:PAS domain S-box-containing protein
MHSPEITPDNDNAGIHVDLLNQLTVVEKQRHELEQELKLLRERFDYVLKATQDAVWDWDLSKNTGWYSEGLNKLFGYNPDDITDGVQFWYDMIHPNDQQRVVDGIHAVIDKGGKNWHDRYRFKRSDGSYAWVLDRGYAIHNSDGQPIRMVGSMQDITAEQENEERLRLVIDAAQIGIWDFHPTTGKLVWDKRCKALFGIAPDDYVDYEIFLQRVHPDDRQAVDEANRNAINGIGNGEYDLEYRTIGLRDQKLRWVRAKGRSYKDEQGITVRYAGTVIEITEEKKQEQRLREEDERFRLLATCIPQIVWTTDEQGIVNYISDKWQAYTGHIPTYQKFSFRELIHPDDRQKVVAGWSKHRKEETTYHGEYRLKNIVTNEYRWFHCTIAPLRDYSGNVIKWIGSATDVHDQKLVELQLENKVAERTKELRTLNEKLEKSNYELEQYAYVTSHDLKEPLRKIQMFTNLITSQYTPELTTQVVQYLNKIETASSRMSGLIDSLLRYSKLSKGVLLFERVDLHVVVKNVMEEFEYSLEQKTSR